MDISKIQGKMTGNQAKAAFAEYNAFAGSAVVDLSRNYNTGDKYCNRISNGNQIDLALAEINVEEGSEIFKVGHLDWSNGARLKFAFAKLNNLVNGDGPIWLGSMPVVVVLTQGDTWPWVLDSYCVSALAISYVSNLSLPPGITLNADGTFTGTASSISGGTAEFTATDTNGDAKSEWIKWSVVSS